MRILLAATAMLVGCTGAGPTADDAPASDASARDAAATDAFSLDAFSLDASSLDATTTDAPSVDAPTSDAAWGSCMAGTIAGTCVDVAHCGVMHASVSGLCRGPTSVECCIPSTSPISCDPTVMIQPNLGIAGEAAGLGGCPSGMVPVTSTLCVDQYEASLVQVNADGTTREWSPYFTPPSTITVRALSRAGAVPQGYVSGVTASAACTAAGKHLCTDAEWLSACQGPAGVTYPYGNTRMTGVCNDHRAVHPAVELFGTSESWIFSMLSDACISQLPMSLARTGQFTGCVSASGAHDMMGNLHELTADPAGTFRGGFYVDTSMNGNGCLYATTAHVMSYEDYSTGFRCCATH